MLQCTTDYNYSGTVVQVTKDTGVEIKAESYCF